MGMQWSDDFDPDSTSKINGASVWFKMLTFLSKNLPSNALENTYPIAIGRKGEDYEIIEKHTY